MQIVVYRPSPESLQRAKPHLLKAIAENRPRVVKEILDAGYPVNLPICETTKQTLLMQAT